MEREKGRGQSEIVRKRRRKGMGDLGSKDRESEVRERVPNEKE